jgi:hypothetical protein
VSSGIEKKKKTHTNHGELDQEKILKEGGQWLSISE